VVITELIDKRDEIGSAIVQATGAALSIFGTLTLIEAARFHGGLAIASVSLYGACLFLSFLCSALYHGVASPNLRGVLRTFDHSAIYLLIAGTYTPVALLLIGEAQGWLLAVIVWTLALTGVALRIFRPNGMTKVRIALYLFLGWLVVIWGHPVVTKLGNAGLLLMALGGSVYSVGVIFYRWKTLNFNRTIWHLFVLFGSLCFYLVIRIHILPVLERLP
jgi:hemolysin III